jgi:putative flavoprotein involved in K+ transport
MTHQPSEQYFDTVVIGGGQAGLAMGYFLARDDRDFVILDAGYRVSETWRNRWDSLRLFTPAFHDGLPGMPFPARSNYFPTKDETADYLEAYARKFALPVRFGRRVDSLTLHDGVYLVSAGYERYVAEHVVVATGPYQHPKIPDFATGLDPEILQLHSSEYHNPDQLPEAEVLVVGAGNSGAEISVDLAATRRTYLSGRNAGYIPIGLIHNRFSLWLADRVLTTDTRLGRKMSEAHRDRGPRLSASNPRRSRRLASKGCPRSKASWMASPGLLMAGCWMWPSWCGQLASVSTSAGSSYPSSTMVAIQSTIGVWWIPRLACTFSGCLSSTPPPQSTSEGSGRTHAT